MEVIDIIMLAPIQRGILALLISGIVLPLCGVPLVELNLLPMRFMLMHGALLGGSIAVAYGLSPLVMMIGINIVFVLIITYVSVKKSIELGRLSSFFMVSSLGGAALITQVKSVPGQSLLTLLWGSPYALSRIDLSVFIIWAIMAVILFFVFRNSFTAYLFDPIMAKSLGVKTELLGYLINILIGLSVALAMKLLGALLVDVLLILPVVIAGFWKKGQRYYVILSVVIGSVLTIIGILGSLFFDLPVSGIMAFAGSFIFLFLLILKERR